MDNNFVVQIQNFQIIEKAKLEFENGLNIIVGPSNNGKTAIIRAIEAAIYNKVGNSFIRNGTEATGVGIRYNGHSVVWKKSEDGGSYTVDGNTYLKIGRGQLDEVARALSMSEIDVNTDKVRINFLKQMEYPFLLDKTPSQLFEFLSMSNDNDKLAAVFQSMRSDLKSTNSNIDITSGRVDSLKEVIVREKAILDNYKDIEEVTEKVLSLEPRVQSYYALINYLDSIKNDKESLLSRRDGIKKLRQINAELSEPVSLLEERIPAIETLSKSVESIKNKLNTLKTKKEVILSLRSKIELYNNVLAEIDPESISQKRDLINKLKTNIATVNNLAGKLRESESNIERYEDSLAEVESKLSEFTVCPLCGSPLTGEHEHSN